MTLLLLPALFLGLRGKAIGPYGLFASLVMILAVLAGTPLQLAWLGAYLLWESLLVCLYIPLRQKKGPVPWHYALALFLQSAIPLLLIEMERSHHSFPLFLPGAFLSHLPGGPDHHRDL